MSKTPDNKCPHLHQRIVTPNASRPPFDGTFNSGVFITVERPRRYRYCDDCKRVLTEAV